MPAFADITGQRFGRLQATSWIRVSYPSTTLIKWRCVCDCGREILATSSELKRGAVKSCRCWNVEDTVRRTLRHGMKNTPLHNAWAGMKARCCNPNAANYPYYGGRGITVCDRWLDSELGFLNFLADMGDRPTDRHTLDRINVNGNYNPNNCRWSDIDTQANNRRNSIKLTLNGRTQSLTQWARELGISHTTLRQRVSLGWSDEQVLTKPVRKLAYQPILTQSV